MGKSRTAVLALVVLALAAVSVALWWLRGRPPRKLDCPPEQVRLSADGVARCDPGGRGALPSAAARLTAGARLDLNRATADDLAAIDGVGPALARALVEARQQAGGFTDWDQVDQVAGVGAARLEGLKAATTLGPP